MGRTHPVSVLKEVAVQGGGREITVCGMWYFRVRSEHRVLGALRGFPVQNRKSREARGRLEWGRVQYDRSIRYGLGSQRGR